MRHRYSSGEFVIALGVIALGLGLVAGTLAIPTSGGYERIGPTAWPWAVALCLIVIGILLARRTLEQRSSVPGAESAPRRVESVPFTFVSIGLILHLLLIERAGFVIASAILFFCTAYALGARHRALTAVIAVALAVAIYFAFTRGLELNLPGGILRGMD